MSNATGRTGLITREECASRGSVMRRQADHLIEQALYAAAVLRDNADRIHPRGAANYAAPTPRDPDARPTTETEDRVMGIVAEVVNKLSDQVRAKDAEIAAKDKQLAEQAAGHGESAAALQAKVEELDGTVTALQKQLLAAADQTKLGVLDEADIAAITAAGELVG